MAELRRFGAADLGLLLLVVAVAAGARAGYLLTCADGGNSPGPLLVEDPGPSWPGAAERGELEELARNVRDRNYFGGHAPLAEREEETAHAAPGYPWLLGLLGKVVDPTTVDRTVRWTQCGLGALTAGLYFLFARRAFRSLLVGTLAGLFCALHPFWVIDTAALADGVLASFLLGLALFVGARAVQTGGAFASLLFGLALAGLALVRAALLPFGFVAVAWFLLRSRVVPRGWLCAVVGFLGFATGLAPWAVRNWQVFHEPVPVVDSAYLHLWAGNHEGATGGPPDEAAWRQLPAAELAPLPQPQRYARLAPLVAEEVRTQPAETIQRRLRAALYFLFGERWFRDGRLAEARTGDEAAMPGWLANAYPVALPAVLLGMFGLAFLGWRWTYGWRAESMPASLAVIWIPLPYILSHAGALAGQRLPLDGVLLTYAAFALACAVPGTSRYLLGGAWYRPTTPD
jgi:4-amino-4-deoxy-L-arabinose transferase-like glycosyltransferase